MGIQITTQPQVLKTDTVIIGTNNNNNLSAVSGLTVYGEVSASGGFRGDGSKLTGLVATGIAGISLVNSIDGLTGNVANAYIPISGNKTITGSLTSVGSLVLSGVNASFSATSLSATSISGTYYGDGSNLSNVKTTNLNNVSGGNIAGTTGINLSSASLTAVSGIFTTVSAGTYYGDGSKLTGVVATSLGNVSLVNSIDGLTGNITNAYIPLSGNKTITGPLTSNSNLFLGSNNVNNIVTTVIGNSADWNIGKTLSSSGGRLGGNTTVQGNLTANYITALSGSTFVNTVFTTTSALCVVGQINTGPAFYVGATGIGDIASFYDLNTGIEMLHVAGSDGDNPNVGVKTSTPNKDFTVNGEISAASAAWFDRITLKTNITAVSGFFTSGVSGTHYGDGSKLTGVVATSLGNVSLVNSIDGLTGNITNAYIPLSGNKTITGSLTSTGNLILSGVNTTLSAVSISGTHYGDGSNLTNIRITNLNNVSGGNIAGTTGINLSSASLSAVNGVFTTSLSTTSLTAVNATIRNTLSTVTISADNLVISGYPLQAVSRVYQVGATAATTTYTLALSDNNNTLTMYTGTSGTFIIPNTITFPIGFQTNIMQLSTGRITLSAQGNNLFNDMNSFKTYKQYSTATIINMGSIWVTYGSLSS